MRALISVSDKTGIVDFAKSLSALGVEIISTGGTHKLLSDNGVAVIPIDDVTEFPEMMDGRVKTLHPKIHGGLLAKRDKATHMQSAEDHGIHMIDMVVVNLYPFEQTIQQENVTLDQAIEQIDIGGPSMIRSAAKNYESVAVVVNSDHYGTIINQLESGGLTLELKQKLALEAFDHTSYYDGVIATYLRKQIEKKDERFPEIISTRLRKCATLRYGENPHQEAAFYTMNGQNHGLPSLKQHHGKALSYNNLIDLEAAWQIVKEFQNPTAVIIKHTNPCGAASGTSIAEAYQRAHDADPVSAFGSIVGLNHPVSLDCAQRISETFVELVLAPSFDADAFELLSKKPSIRLITIDSFYSGEQSMTLRYVQGGFLAQSPDDCIVDESKENIVTNRAPNQQEKDDLAFAFAICKHVKSNAIVLVKNQQTIGVGAGQMSRVEAVEIALKKAGESAQNAVVGSDAFFPFKDSVEKLAGAGIKAIIQPGGSKRDQESIDACDEHGLSMLFTGIRHFKH